MLLSDAIQNRIKYYLNKNNMTVWQLYKATGIPKSTSSAIVAGTSKIPKLDTILHICEGFNITLIDFFSDPIFNDVEQE